MLGTDRTLTDLREYTGSIRWAQENLYCPACRCTKTGTADAPNSVTEACEGPCRCHDEDAE